MSEFWKKVQEYSENAPEAGYSNINYGKLTVTPMVVRWKDKKPTKTPLAPGQVLEKNETLELSIKVDIREFNPSLEFEYERSVSVRKSGKVVKTDWSEIVLPSLEKVFGENWAEALEKQPYVAVEDVPNVAGRVSSSGKVLQTPKIVAAYPSKEACFAAWKERYGREEDPSSDFPPEIVAQAKALIASVGEDNALKMLSESKPFGDYDAEGLIRAAAK